MSSLNFSGWVEKSLYWTFRPEKRAGWNRVFAKVDSIRQGIFGPMHEWLAGRLLPTYLLMLRPNGSRAAGTTHSGLGPVRPTLSQFERVSNPNRCESDLYSSLHSGTAVSPPLPPGQRCSTAKKKGRCKKKRQKLLLQPSPFHCSREMHAPR